MLKKQENTASVELSELDLEVMAGGLQKVDSALSIASQLGVNVGGSGGGRNFNGNGFNQQRNQRR